MTGITSIISITIYFLFIHPLIRINSYQLIPTIDIAGYNTTESVSSQTSVTPPLLLEETNPILLATEVRQIGRKDSIILGWVLSSQIGITNPWASPGYTHQEGNNFMWEPLYWFGIFADKEIPWLAESMEYTKEDFTELTIKD